MFGRRNDPLTPSTPVVDEPPVGIVEDNRKGRPTPKRKEAEAARKRPLVPEDRKTAAKAQRAAAKEQRDREYRAMQVGDEKHMPRRDRGPLKRYVRDYVDARFSLGEFFLPIAAVCLVFQLAFANANVVISIVSLFLLYLYVIAAVIDGAVMWFRLKRRIIAKFDAVPRGTLMYAITRAFQFRRSRLPKPQVKRRAYPQ